MVSRFLPDWKSTKEQRLDWVRNYEIPANNEFLNTVPGKIQEQTLKLAIILKESNKCIGWCCSEIKEELTPPNREVMYAFSERYGNSYKSYKGVDYIFV